MPYSIFMLPEELITVTGTNGGSGLDGQTQGSGVHLAPPNVSSSGAVITLNSNAWEEIEIDDDDANFGDSDTSQTLVNTETFGGQTFPANSIVEAEYAVIVEDPLGNQYQLVAFNIRQSGDSNSYGNVEGLAFIGPQGGFPPIGVPLTVISNEEGPNIAASTYATPICFAQGTLMTTPKGEVAVEDLRVGDLVHTEENGAEPVRWIGHKTFPAKAQFAPIEFAPGAIGNTRALRLSRQHRLLLTGWRAELFFGDEAVWVPAAHFLDWPGVRVVEGGMVTYFHVLLDGHRTLLAEGVEAESLHPGDVALCSLGATAEAELFAMFPEIERLSRRATSRPSLRAIEARAALAA
ncbi:Hint domain-containing protein [Rhodobacteraceae bacterium N5(2021)]|uniref:Hint domain-containing protein n=1 Tax=Gymnodinialimonas phycosphaerae TaxID=2841589 RepID=A0A975TWC9_9RHOB|nr:Hint domain-containing protein [Gymnodinialimonas phycosphaerae]MBY4895295.1 Hint domain-containing protein [Gymnodinialimonas phycosphaerae]